MKRILILGFVLAFCSCTKVADDHNASGEVKYLSDEIKDYFNYKKGSYWICKDSLSGHTDSFVVVDYADLIVRDGSPNHEERGIAINEYSMDSLQLLPYMWTISLDYLNTALFSFYPGGKQPLDLFLGYNESKVGDFTDNATSCGEVIPRYCHFLSLVIIDSNQYQDVYETGISNNVDDCFDFKRTDRVFINKEVGLIKIEQNNTYRNRVWELQRYKVYR